MLKILSEDELPRRNRKSESRFEKTPDWVSLKKILDNDGIKPGAGVQLSLTKADMDKAGINEPRTIFRFIKGYIQSENLDFVINTVNREDGTVHFKIRHMGPDELKAAAKLRKAKKG